MSTYRKSEHWSDPANKLFPHQVGFTCPPHDLDAAPSDFRNADGIAERALHHIEAMEAAVDKPVIASDTTLYWAMFTTLGVAPSFAPGKLLGMLCLA